MVVLKNTGVALKTPIRSKLHLVGDGVLEKSGRGGVARMNPAGGELHVRVIIFPSELTKRTCERWFQAARACEHRGQKRC